MLWGVANSLIFAFWRAVKITTMEQEIIEGFKLIETFMGRTPKNPVTLLNDSGTCATPDFKDIDEWVKKGFYPIGEYHKSWDALMPVVEKITQIEDGRFSVDISSVGMWACFIKRDDISERGIVDYGGFEPMIMNVWKSVVGFILWYMKFKGTTAVGAVTPKRKN